MDKQLHQRGCKREREQQGLGSACRKKIFFSVYHIGNGNGRHFQNFLEKWEGGSVCLLV